MVEQGHHITRELTTRYTAVLVVLGALAVASFLGLVHILVEAENGAALVNVAGRQRMLVERSALAAVRLRDGDPKAAAILASALEQLGDAHEALKAGLPERRSHDAPSAGVQALLYGPDGSIDADIHGFIGHGRALLARPPGGPFPPGDPDLDAVLDAAEFRLISQLDSLVSRYQQESESTVRQVFSWHGMALALTLLMLILSAAAVFRPMVARLESHISVQRRAEKELRDSEERLWRILEESPVGVSVSRRADGVVVFANSRFTDILGMKKQEFIGSAARSHYVDDDQRRHVLAQLRLNGHIDDAEVEFRRKDGTPFWALLTIRPAEFEGSPVNLAWIYDITARKIADEKIKLAAKVLETVNEAVVITNSHNEIEFVNPAFTHITEYTSEDVLWKNPRMLRSGRHEEEFYRAMWETLAREGRWQGEIWNRRKSGEFYAEWLSIAALKDENGATTHHIAVFSDITNRKEDEERVWRQANYDALTGLPNRSLFIDRLSQAVRQSQRDNKKFALMFIDLDGFKQVNDTLGHAAGDLLLQQTAERLSECMRSSDTVARLAGDEFTIILQGISGRLDVANVAAKILEAIARPFTLDGQTARVQGSIGISVFPDNGDTGAVLLKMADEAMYSVKKRGKNNFEFIDGR